VGDTPGTPYALPLQELERRSEPAFANRPLAAVAQNGTHRSWLFGRAYKAAESTEADLPLAAYDTSTVDDLTLGPRLPLEFVVATGPLLTPFVDEVAQPGTDQRIFFEVSSFVPHVDVQRGGEIFFLKRVGFDSAGVWLADVASGAARAIRRSAPLFAPLFAAGARDHVAGERDYLHAAWRGEQYLTVYRCDGASASCSVARAPNGSEDRADAYEARTQDASGTWSWTRDLQAATPVISGVLTDLTVSYNRYLGRYLAVHLASPLQPTIVLETALAAEGPWTPFATVSVPGTPLGFIFHAHEQPALADRCGKRVAVSYFEPSAVEGSIFPTSGTTVVSYLELP
jgi:hypothetical protein